MVLGQTTVLTASPSRPIIYKYTKRGYFLKEPCYNTYMKILIIDKEAIYRNGVVIYNSRLDHFLKQKKHEVHYLRFSHRHKGQEGNVTYIPFIWGIEKFWMIIIPSFNTLSLIKNAVRKIKPDIAYTTLGMTAFDVFLPRVFHKESIPLAATLHVDISGKLNFYEFWLRVLWAIFYLPTAVQFDLFHVFSRRTKNFFTKLGTKKENIIALPNGVDSQLYSPGDSEFGKKNNIKRGILSLGRLSWQKNLPLLIESFLKTNPSPTIKLVIVGNGEMELALRKKYQDERIIFTGFVEKDTDRIDIIRSCQIFALPSRGEGMSLSMLEAMSCGLVPVASNVASNQEVIGHTGSVIPFNKLKEELPRVLKRYIDDENLTKKLGIKARQRIQSNYNLDKKFNALLTSFEKTIENSNR